MTTTQLTKWTTTAGPRQTTAANDSISKFLWRAKQHIVLSGIVGGQERRTELYAFGSEPTPEAIDALEAIGRKYGHTITADNYRDIIAEVEQARNDLQLPVEDERISPDREQERKRQLEQDRLEREAKAAIEAAKSSACEAELRKSYPWAKQDGSDWARAAANIRKELALAFPGQKFSVRSDAYSMGNSVDIRWTDGPTTKEVEAITSKYSYGRFDGMTDSYDSDRSPEGLAVERVLGRAKYVQCHRSDSPEAMERIRQGNEWRSESGHDDQNRQWRVWCRTSFYVPTAMPEHKAVEGGKVGSYDIEKHYHTKKCRDMWLCVPVERMEDSAYQAELERAKAMAGWYSRKWGTTPGGFAFWEEQQARDFAGRSDGGENGPPNDTPPPQPYSHVVDKADKLIADLDRPRLENTPKRQREAASRMCERNKVDRIRAAALALNGMDGPPRGLRWKDFEAALATRLDSSGYYDLHDTFQYRPTDNPTYQLLQSLVDPLTGKQRQDDMRDQHYAATADIPGFFPTPPDLADEIVQRLDVPAGQLVMEPSAGNGALCDAIARAGGVPFGWEINPTLAAIAGKKYAIECDDFLEQEPQADGVEYIAMNPPFENGQAVDHIRHAFDWLRPGGKLVAIGPASLLFRSDSHHTEFREWVLDHGGKIESVEGQPFAAGLRPTGVSVCIVEMQKG